MRDIGPECDFVTDIACELPLVLDCWKLPRVSVVSCTGSGVCPTSR